MQYLKQKVAGLNSSAALRLHELSSKMQRKYFVVVSWFRSEKRSSIVL